MTCANGSQVAREEDNRWIACEMEAGVEAIGDGGVYCVQRRADHDQSAGIERLAVAESEIIANGIICASSGYPARTHGHQPPPLPSAGISPKMSPAHQLPLQATLLDRQDVPALDELSHPCLP